MLHFSGMLLVNSLHIAVYVCVCVRVCGVCMCVHVYIYIYTDILLKKNNTKIQSKTTKGQEKSNFCCLYLKSLVYICRHTHVLAHTRARTHTHTCGCVYIYTYIYTHTDVCVRVCARVCIKYIATILNNAKYNATRVCL